MARHQTRSPALAYPLPGYVKAIFAIVLVGGAGVVYTSWQTASLRLEQKHKLCERTVEAREDGRAVWLYLVDSNPNQEDDQTVTEFVTFLNDRLPRLECVDDIPTPVEGP